MNTARIWRGADSQRATKKIKKKSRRPYSRVHADRTSYCLAYARRPKETRSVMLMRRVGRRLTEGVVTPFTLYGLAIQTRVQGVPPDTSYETKKKKQAPLLPLNQTTDSSSKRDTSATH